ncbi:hypothetical protein JXA56_01450 [Candidatus Micrarchaeota archaeon]|nr:hypothetical protein [Candidatus Micrarchaeota archaeon]
MKRFMILILLVCFAFAQYSSQGESGGAPEAFSGMLMVNKSAPESVSLTDTFTVVIMITNNGPATAQVTIREAIGNIEPVDIVPAISDIQDESLTVAYPPLMTWNLEVPAAGAVSVSYKAKPKTVGTISIGPTEVIAGNSKFLSNGLFIRVECTSSPECDESIGETPLTCPDKCGGNAEAAVPEAPQMDDIPTDPYVQPADPASIPPDQRDMEEKTGQMLLVGIAILLVAAVAAYLLVLKKK